MTDLTEQEAQELFKQASAAISEADNLKLTELFKEPVAGEGNEGGNDGDGEDTGADTSTSTNEGDDGNDGGNADGDGADDGDQGNPPSGTTEGADGDGDGKAKTELDELRDQLQKMQKENHALRSQAGRIPHVQRKIKELDEKLEELNKRATSPSNRPSTAIQEKVKEALKGISETDAELADAIAQAVAHATTAQEDDAFNRERATLELLKQQNYAEYREAQVDRLLSMYPNAREVFSSPSWKQWKSEQTERILALAESDNADDVAFVFDVYAKDMVAKNPALAQKAEADEAAAKAKEEATRKAAQIEQERKSKQERSVVVGSPAAQGKVSLPDDPQALFEKFSSEIRKGISG